MPAGEPPPANATDLVYAQAFAGFFDAEWYRARYPDIAGAGLDPLDHFVRHGVAEGRDPNQWFDNAWYREHYPDVAASGINPLLHYLQVGGIEGRNPHPHFDALWYVQQHPEAAPNPLLHHVRVGRRAGWATEKPLDIADYLPSVGRRPSAPGDVAVDVVVPVYKGLEQTRRCLQSVLADPDRFASRIIVVDDRSPEPRLSAYLDRLAARGTITLVRNRRNLGFVASVNRGMQAAGRHDVVLLNSDTEVPAGWLRRLTAQAYARLRIASVSPFSNNATICSCPRDAGGPIPFGMSLREADDLCAEVNAGRSVPVPTTVGFCMYIRREALDAVGGFDEKEFGRGYGEENDFCMRAAQAGWEHRLACDLFVYHEGSVSFGPNAGELAQGGFERVSTRYPDYPRIVARHVALDAVGSCRFAVTLSVMARSPLPKLLMVMHDLGGGVKRHADRLIETLDGKAHCLLLAASGRGTTLSVPTLPGHPTLTLPADRIDDLVQLLSYARVGRVHIHHLMGVDMDIRALVHRLRVPFDVTVHDYFALCPQVNMLPWPDQPYCGEPAPSVCNACIADRPSHGARDILSWRREQFWQFLEADRVLCPSDDTVARLRRHGLGEQAVFAPHEAVQPASSRVSAPPLRRGGRMRVGLLGVLANHKGALTAASVAEAADPDRLLFRLVGHTEDDFPADAAHLLHATGPYEDADLPGLIATAQPHVIWFPARWPETFSYTLSAALAAGLPIVAARIGAFPERLAGRPLTWLVDPDATAAEWLAVFEQVRTALGSRRSVASALNAGSAGQCPPGEQGEERPSTLKLRKPGRPESSDGETLPALDGQQSRIRPAAAVGDPVGSLTARPWAGNPAPAFYPGGYLLPAGSGSRGTLTDLRRPGRTAVVVVPERLDNGALSPCAYIRLLQPLDHPDTGAGLDLVIADAAEALCYKADLIITQRYGVPGEEAADALAAHARATEAALVYDLDDDLLNVPLTHADAVELRPKARVVLRMLRQATQVWVSTPELAAAIAYVRDDAVIVPNALDERLWVAPAAAPRGPGSPLRILYMGTATHGADFALIQPGLARLKEEFGDRVSVDMLGVTSAGDLPSWIRRLGMTAAGYACYPGFVNWIIQQPAWDVGLAPLADTAFNRSKSMIKTLDYGALGLPVLASDTPAYRGSLADGWGGQLVTNDPHAWYAALSWLRRDPAALRRLAKGAGEAFAASGTLASQAEARRAAIRTALAARAPAPVVRRRRAVR